MTVLQPLCDDGQFKLDEDQCRAAGAALAERYRNAEPFPHIVLDDFLPLDTLRPVLAAFPESGDRDFYDREQERLKYQYHPQECAPAIRTLLAELNSQAFLGFLSEMTGIDGLIADPYFLGGGLHETKRGGHLGVHADFNIHNRMKVVRRLNLLIYLNEDWDESFGGELELWDRAMQGKRKSIAPVIGRAVVFNTDLDSFHGHPEPLACPPDRSRRSIATYYYTAPVDGIASVPRRTTVFKPRPGTADRADWKLMARHLWKDWAPPALRRMLSRSSPD